MQFQEDIYVYPLFPKSARFLSKSDLRIYINATETRKKNITDLSKLFYSVGF